VWTLAVGSLDNILRPYLIKKGADLPLLLIFAGVIGGMLTLGLVGIFVGPVVLAVAYHADRRLVGTIAGTPSRLRSRIDRRTVQPRNRWLRAEKSGGGGKSARAMLSAHD